MKNRDEWLREVDARQRNIVFPDTVNNQGEFYRGIAYRPLKTPTAKVGFVVLVVFFASFYGLVIYRELADVANRYSSGSTGKVQAVLWNVGIVGGCTVLFVVVLYLAVRHGVRKFTTRHRGRVNRS